MLLTSNLACKTISRPYFHANPVPMAPDSDLNVPLFWWRVTENLRPFLTWGWLFQYYDNSQFILLFSVEKLIVPDHPCVSSETLSTTMVYDLLRKMRLEPMFIKVTAEATKPSREFEFTKKCT